MQGSFFWYELMTPDTAAAAEFYGAVVGWIPKDSGMPGMDYTVFHVDGYQMGVAGMMELTEEFSAQGMPPNWTGYVLVHDVDAMAAKLASKGGSVQRPPEDIPGVGRFAIVADPFGAVFAIMDPQMPEGQSPDMPSMVPGAVGWNELYAGKGEEVFAFYADMFGWSKEMAVDMGPMGIYQCFGINGTAVGGMMPKPEGVPQACWGFYFIVDGLDAAIYRATSRGGKVLNGPHEVPGGSFIVNCLDPQGAAFSLTSAKR